MTPAKSGMLHRSFWAITDNLVQQGLTFVIFSLLARWLTPTEFGLMVVAHLLVQAARTTVLDAIATPIIRSRHRHNVLFDWLFTVSTVSAIAVAAMVCATAPLFASWLAAPQLTWVLVSMSLPILFFGMGRAHEARLLRAANFRLLALRSTIAVSMGGVAAIATAIQGGGVMALVVQQVTTGLLTFLISFAAEWKSWRPRWCWRTSLLKRHFKEIRSVSASACFGFANTQGDAMLVVSLLGPHAAGLYNLAKRLVSAIYLVIGSSLGRVSVSMFLQSTDDPPKLRSAYVKIIRLALLLLLSSYTLLFTMPHEIIRVLFGAHWVESAPVVPILAATFIAQLIFNMGQNLSFNTGKATRVPKLALLQLSVFVTGAFSFSGLGLTAVALWFGAGAALGALLMQAAVKQQLGLSFRDLWNALAPAAVSAGLCGLTIYALRWAGTVASTWPSVVFASSVALAVFGVSAGCCLKFEFRRRSKLAV
jgi:O-antigen/teichoic acid export membrane protein